LSRSLDTFALEFLDMASARKVLAGTDPFVDFTPDWPAVRRELEAEAREKKIQLQRLWLASGGDAKLVRALIADTVPGYLAVLRGVVHVQQASVAPIAVEVLLDGAIHWLGFDPQVWRKLRDTAKGMRTPSSSELTHLMNEYLEQARVLVRHVDGMEIDRGGHDHW
jgi:hypothetical protein